MKQKMWMLRASRMLILSLIVPFSAWAQEEHKERGVGDVVYVPTPQIVVDTMLSMAKVGPKDFVIDLGSGDGRMIITAVKKFGAQGLGVDLSDDLLAEAARNAKIEGVADRAIFVKQNLFETDLTSATIITTYLLPQMNERLRPKILSMKPGTRLVAHDYAMGEWSADETRTLDVPEKKVGTAGKSYLFFWTVPAKVAGRWQAPTRTDSPASQWEFELGQRFQMLDGVAKNGSETVKLRTMEIKGDQISIMFLTKPGDNRTRHEFKGVVNGDAISGTLTVGEGAASKQMSWNLKLIQRGEVKISMATPQ